jgi:hypothetical protein
MSRMDIRLCRKYPPSALQSNLDLGLRVEGFLKKREKKTKAPVGLYRYIGV